MAEIPGGLVCGQCGYENESSRRYCRDCGTRLPSIESAPPEPESDHGLHPIRPTRRIGFTRLVGLLFRTIIYAAITAFVIQLVRSPDDLPADLPVPDAEVATFREQLSRAAGGTGNRVVTVSWATLNAWLAGQLEDASTRGTTFRRAFVVPAGDDVMIFMQREVGGQRFTTGLQLRPVVRTSGLSAQIIGGGIGRIPLPAVGAELMAATFAPVRDRVYSELEILRAARKVTVTAETVSVEFP